jgi:TPR repeat protein
MGVRLRSLVVAVLAIGLFCTSAISGSFEDGQAAYWRGDFVAALRIFQPLAEAGAARAQVALGLLYEDGQGVGRDYGQAVYWYRKAADQGDATGEHGLAILILYENGRGVPQDDAKAVSLYRNAAEQGYANAENGLECMIL